ncbi:MAG: nucleotidyltransferase family protein [Hyphomicrobiaceae bacterium]
MSWVPNTAMVFAAGMGKRMRPLTSSVPKPLVRLAERPLIDHVLDRLSKAGVARAVVNVHYLADKLEAHLAQRAHPEIIISDERDQLLETGGGLIKALALLGEEAIVIHNSDSVWIDGASNDLTRLFQAWDPERMDTLMLLAPTNACLGYDGAGDFDLSAKGNISRRAPSTKSPYVFAGVSIAHPRLFKHAPEGAFSLNTLWDRAIAEKRAYGVCMDGHWMHVGTPEALAEAENLLAKRSAQ